jgi:hypothetical protein
MFTPRSCALSAMSASASAACNEDDTISGATATEPLGKRQLADAAAMSKPRRAQTRASQQGVFRNSTSEVNWRVAGSEAATIYKANPNAEAK